MSILSGWCSTHGRPQCRWCRSEVCQCEKCGHPWRQNAQVREGAAVPNRGGGGARIGAQVKTARGLTALTASPESGPNPTLTRSAEL